MTPTTSRTHRLTAGALVGLAAIVALGTAGTASARNTRGSGGASGCSRPRSSSNRCSASNQIS